MSNLNKIWYHGTNIDFDSFNINCFGKNEHRGDYVGRAFFFAERKETAQKYIKGNGKIIEVQLLINNPLIIDDNFEYDDLIKEIEISDKVPESLKANEKLAREFTWLLLMKEEDKALYVQSKGYDGLIDLKYGQAAVFKNEQIKIIKNPKICYNDSIKKGIKL